MDTQTAKIILFIIVCIFLMLDKVTTYIAISQLQKNNPGFNYLSAEKNPLARWIMSKCGLFWGNILYFFISIGCVYLFVSAFSEVLRRFGVVNYIGITWYIIFILLALVIGNNTYFTLKHSKVLP